MSRIIIRWDVWDKRDLRTGRYKCRVCGQPSVSPKKHYCSDDCRSVFEASISWPWTRYLVWKRDKGLCQRCKQPVKLHDRMNTWRWEPIHGDIDQSTCNNAETHHIIPVVELREAAQVAIEGIVDRFEAEKAFARAYMIMYFDLNNLITYCYQCHTAEHVKMNKAKRRQESPISRLPAKLRAFMEFNDFMEKQRRISEYFGRH